MLLSGTLSPGQPIHVKSMVFFVPRRAETSPPDDLLNAKPPGTLGSILIVTGSRLETTTSRSVGSGMMDCGGRARGGERWGSVGSWAASLSCVPLCASVFCIASCTRINVSIYYIYLRISAWASLFGGRLIGSCSLCCTKS